MIFSKERSHLGENLFNFYRSQRILSICRRFDYIHICVKPYTYIVIHKHTHAYVEKGKATHSSILAWKIPQTEEPDGL